MLASIEELGRLVCAALVPPFPHWPCSLPLCRARQLAEAASTRVQTAACQPRPATCLNLVPSPGRSTEQGVLRRVVRVEPLQNLLPILPALLVGSQAAGVQAGAGGVGTGAGTAPAALMTDTASHLWKADADGERLLAAGCCFCLFLKLHGISRGRHAQLCSGGSQLHTSTQTWHSELAVRARFLR